MQSGHPPPGDMMFAGSVPSLQYNDSNAGLIFPVGKNQRSDLRLLQHPSLKAQGTYKSTLMSNNPVLEEQEDELQPWDEDRM